MKNFEYLQPKTIEAYKQDLQAFAHFRGNHGCADCPVTLGSACVILRPVTLN